MLSMQMLSISNIMTMRSVLSLSLLALTTVSWLPATSAHSWIEEMQVIDNNGTYIGDRGFSRGFVDRADPTFTGDSTVYLLPGATGGSHINSTDLLCHPWQRTQNYSAAFPMLTVTPDSYVAMKYLENGHVTLPWNQIGKPAGTGTVFVYGTTEPSNTETIVDVLAWNSDKTGGNKKGFLMAAQNFDDGRCHQINCGNISMERQLTDPVHLEGQPNSPGFEQWCETDLHIPAGTPTGTLSVYWVWQWNTAPGHDCGLPFGKDEYYTTCSDFNVVAAGGNDVDAKILSETGHNTINVETPMSTAVSDYKSRTAVTTSPAYIVVDGSSTVTGSLETPASSFMSACSATPNFNIPSVSYSCDGPVSSWPSEAVASASSVLKQFDTTLGLSAPAVATSAAAPSSSMAASSTPTSSAAPSSSMVSSSLSAYTPAKAATASTSAAPSAMITVTITATTTEATTETTTVTAGSPSSESSAPASSSSSSVAVSSSASAPALASASSVAYFNSDSITFRMLSTVTAPYESSTSASTPAAASDAPIIPTVASNGTVMKRAAEHLAHRRHARSFA